MTGKSDNQNLFSEDEWLEFIEGEMPASLEQDMQLLLMNSKKDREIAESIKLTRELVKSSDNVSLPEDGRAYQSLHDRIMKEIEQTSEPTSPPPKKRSTTRFLFGTALLSLYLVTIGGMAWGDDDPVWDDPAWLFLFEE